MLDFLGHVRASRASPRPRRGASRYRRRTPRRSWPHVEQFYLFMHDNKDAAAAAARRPGLAASWAPQHAGFYRRGELPGKSRPRARALDIIDDAAMTQIMAGIGLLGDARRRRRAGRPASHADHDAAGQAGPAGQRDLPAGRDPLLPLLSAPARSPQPARQALTARLRYQQTKIDGAPDTILVDAEIVAIIRAQQEWAAAWPGEHAAPGTRPRSTCSWPAVQPQRRPALRWRRRSTSPLTELARRLDMRDSAGALVDFKRTHRFRHTRATSLLNAGVPIHVVQRYLGHLSPAMTMHYAQTLADTHEAEFLRYRKLTADARDLGIDPTRPLRHAAAGQRTDRILPNGWCLLPPRQVCGKGNACLTCDKFATDATFLPELNDQLQRTGLLIETRQATFTARTGTPMSEDNVWLAGRRTEQNALHAIIIELEKNPGTAAEPKAVRGAGTTARTDPVTGRKETR